MLIAAHNLTAMNASRQYGITTKNRAKTAEKLSTGYDINRAADNAAGLAISEKMRRLIRGLERGTKNAEDGVSWTQIGDGALNEVHDVLHRMTELSIQSLNETNSEKDRAYLQSEFEHLQTELDRISKTTEFNELNIFEEHEPTYYQCEGDIQWPYDQIHTIEDGQNDLTIKYRKDDKGTQETINITVPPGDYTTQELVDKIDSYDNVSYGSVELQSAYFQGGYVLPSSAKDEEYNVFRIDSSNNQLTIQANDMTSPVTITIPEGEYSIAQMASQLNSLFSSELGLDKLSVTYDASGSYYGLKITSQVEGLDSKIDIDGNSSAYKELFVNRDYTQYMTNSSDKPNVTNETKADCVASFKGSKSLSGVNATTPLTITSGVNDTFTLRVDSNSYDITLSAGDYTSATQISDEINAQLLNAGLTDIEAVVSNNSIKIQGTAASTTKDITAQAKGTNGGYQYLIQVQQIIERQIRMLMAQQRLAHGMIVMLERLKSFRVQQMLNMIDQLVLRCL